MVSGRGRSWDHSPQLSHTIRPPLFIWQRLQQALLNSCPEFGVGSPQPKDKQQPCAVTRAESTLNLGMRETGVDGCLILWSLYPYCLLPGDLEDVLCFVLFGLVVGFLVWGWWFLVFFFFTYYLNKKKKKGEGKWLCNCWTDSTSASFVRRHLNTRELRKCSFLSNLMIYIFTH